MGIMYSRSELKIQQIHREYSEGTIITDHSYQRRSVWLERDKIRLIETILLELIIPEIYFWDAETDADTGRTITHIVDGQQRIIAITDFIEGRFKLQKEHLIDEGIKELFADKYFQDLDSETRKMIWSFPLSIIRINNHNNKDEVRKIFYRVNLTNYSLNDQEKRHSHSWGKFADLTKEVSDLEFWDEYALFNSGDIRRMKDQEFFSTLILLARKGIIDQTTQKPMNDAYIDYSNEYNEYQEDFSLIKSWLEVFRVLYSADIKSFIRKRTQLYTFFCLIDYMVKNDISITDKLKERLYDFVAKYQLFENAPNDDDFNNGYEIIKKYKLASSEGVNKLKNRKIRYELLRQYVIDGMIE